MDSPFKTPSKVPLTQVLSSSGSSSPFTPKRSRIKRKSNEEFSSVSRVLAFDDCNSHSSDNRSLEILPRSQQTLVRCENTCINSNQTTPVKTQQTFVGDEKSNKILLSPSIKSRPKRFNITEQEKNFLLPSPSKRSGSNNSTPSKKLKSIQNCKPITDYFKPIKKRLVSIDNVSGYFPTAQHELNEENMNSKICIKSEAFVDTIESSKFAISTKPTNQSLNIISEKNKSTRRDCIKKKVTPNKSENNVVINYQSPIKNSVRLQSEKSPRNEGKESPCSNKNNTTLLNGAEQVTPSKNATISNNIMRSPRIIDYLGNKVNISGGDTYSRFLKFIVLRPEPFFFGRSDIMTKIEDCSNDELKMYGRLIARKHGWIRFDGPDGLQKYKELNICKDFNAVLLSLATKHLIITDITSCELDCLLNILKSPELKELQKTFNINSSVSNKNKTKEAMIKSFISHVKNQRTFCGNSINNLKECVKKKLGYCLKLSDQSRDDIMSCLIYESYPYFKGEEKDRLRETLTKFSLVEKKELKFPKFETKRVSVNFSSKDSFEMYIIAINLRSKVQLSLEQKDYENAISVLEIVFEKFKSAVFNKSIIDPLSNIPTYLRKYSAVSVYAHTLFKNITILKKSTTDEDLAKKVLEFLLKHKNFLMSKRADLHIELAKVFESQYKQLDLAAKVILDGLKDNTMSELDHQMLSNRAVMYANRKIRKMDGVLKKELLDLTSFTEHKLPSITINGKIISINEKMTSGRKQVYSKKNENGELLYMSVEEFALSHYKSLGFLNGIHDEGQLIKSMFLLCFWDIIYGSYPPHVLFIRQFQDCPLDWRTRHFYIIREKEINDRLTELKQMDVNQICDMLKVRCEEYYDTQSVIQWNFMNVDNLPQCKTLLESVGIEVFLAIGNQILKDGRVYLHGMPDLVVWDSVNLKCKFVEVKGPNDKLSERQYSWLHKLMMFGAHVEVCHVVGTGSKTNKRKNSD